MIYYDGVPKQFLNKDLKDVDKLNFAKAKWLSNHGNHLLKMDKSSESEARKLFKFLDYNNANIVSKHQIRLLIMYYKEQLGSSENGSNFVIKKLNGLLSLPNQKVFDENTFTFFFSQEDPRERTTFMHLRP